MKSQETPVAAIRCLVFGVFVAFSGGCSNHWKDAYETTRVAANLRFAASESVEVREVEPLRLQQYREEYDKRRAASDIAIEDLPLKDHFIEMDRLLACLRVPHRTPEALVIGVTQRTQLGSNAIDGQLSEFAMAEGADLVVFCREFGGRVRAYDSVPVTVYRGGQTSIYRDKNGKRRVYQDNSTDTAYVPVAVDKDSWHITAFLIRKLRAGDPAPE